MEQHRKVFCKRLVSLAASLAAVAAPLGCRAGSDDAGTTVVTSFYPLAHVAERVGGDGVSVANLTPGSGEPHDLELTTDQIEELLDADVAAVMGGGFQPAVEDAIDGRDGPTVVVLDVLGETEGVDEEDPHVWLDPPLWSETVGLVEQALVEADPEGRAAYERRAQALRAGLAELDAAYRDGLLDCRRRLLVTSHESFGYLAARYGLEQEGVAGISPDIEPDPARLGELAELARDEGVTTVFTEDLVSPEIAETLAREAGGLRTEVLSPLEGLTNQQSDAGYDYFDVMYDNLEKLRTALDCT